MNTLKTIGYVVIWLVSYTTVFITTFNMMEYFFG